ncbi:MAG TPA: hypothetical protein VM165_06670, partial [Planctomycetaceae bacterium]|nr:hypothetical protein [Planctomycetaceae bacterium]
MRWIGRVATTMLVVRLASSFAVSAEPVMPTFAAFDRDRNGLVSEAEFVAQSPGEPELWRRDFRLCDWNGDGVLAPNEFAGCPTLFLATERGPWPDPMDAVLERYVAMFDEHWERWDVNKNGEMSQGEFVSGTLALAVTPLKTAAVNACDPNGDGLVSRTEVRGVLERMLGYRAWNDLPLRQPNGCLTNGSQFRSLDRNDDGSLFPHELEKVAFPNSTAQQSWRILDTDRDGKVEFAEWHKAEQFSVFDPISEFRRMDTNLDVRLDSDELRSGVPESHRQLAACLLPGFDVDQDGVLSLAEYRCCPLGNPVLNWHRELRDANSDGHIVFEEFLYGGGQFRLLAWEYFQQLDWNQDRFLDQNEFYFHTKQPDAIYTVEGDGTDWRRFLQPQDYRDLESVAVSPDGQTIAFVRWRKDVGGASTTSELCIVDRTTREQRFLGPGRWPSWSPDGKSLICRRSENNVDAICTVDLNGQSTPLKATGFSAVWSPDGRRLASIYTHYVYYWSEDGQRSLCFHLHPATSPFSHLNEHFCWSPDGRWLCLRGTKTNRSLQIVTINAGGPELGFRIHDTTEQSSGCIAWHPRGDRIVFSKFCTDRSRNQLYEFNPDNADPPRLFLGQDP